MRSAGGDGAVLSAGFRDRRFATTLQHELSRYAVPLAQRGTRSALHLKWSTFGLRHQPKVGAVQRLRGALRFAKICATDFRETL